MTKKYVPSWVRRQRVAMILVLGAVIFLPTISPVGSPILQWQWWVSMSLGLLATAFMIYTPKRKN